MTNNTEDGGATFPLPGSYYSKGMTLRDYFAGQALAGMMAGEAGHPSSPATSKDIAEFAYIMADAMIAERSKDKGEEQ